MPVHSQLDMLTREDWSLSFQSEAPARYVDECNEMLVALGIDHNCWAMHIYARRSLDKFQSVHRFLLALLIPLGALIPRDHHQRPNGGKTGRGGRTTIGRASMTG